METCAEHIHHLEDTIAYVHIYGVIAVILAGIAVYLSTLALRNNWGNQKCDLD